MDSLQINEELSSKDSRYSLVNYLPSDSDPDDDESIEQAYKVRFEANCPHTKTSDQRSSLTSIGVPSSPCPSGCSIGHSLDIARFCEPPSVLVEGQLSDVSRNVGVGRGTKRRSSCTNEAITILPNRVALTAIQDFQETNIVLRKDPRTNELGISVLGGSDTYLEAVCVTEVHPDGAAYRDGRLRKGDVILAANDISFRDVHSADAVRVLREASSPLKLMILRENPQTLFTTSQPPTKFITVELRKASIKDKLGLSLIQRTNGRGVFITYTQPGSIAGRHCDQIMQGDQILEVNGANVREWNQKDVAQLMNGLDGAIVLLLGRVQSLTSNIQEWSRKKSHLQHWRTRTCTWSSYTASGKEKVQNQRPSLPISKDSAVYFSIHSPDKDSDVGLSLTNVLASLSNVAGLDNDDLGAISRSSSIRSRVRLSIVVEDSDGKLYHESQVGAEDSDEDSETQPYSASNENNLVPSIQVTEF